MDRPARPPPRQRDGRRQLVRQQQERHPGGPQSVRTRASASPSSTATISTACGTGLRPGRPTRELADDQADSTHNNLSLVYRSSTSGLLKVAFSVPDLESPPTGATATATSRRARGEAAATAAAATTSPCRGREVIGVLAMTRERPRVQSAGRRTGRRQRGGAHRPADRLDRQASERRGLILHHPRLEKGKLAAARSRSCSIASTRESADRPRLRRQRAFPRRRGYGDPLAPDANDRSIGAPSSRCATKSAT